jgi:UDP-N-acetylglucosamine diphosphorylase/glucosamine-1-phosphate N-acetyltransferase
MSKPTFMINYILFDDHWNDFLPLTFTRPVAELRIGIMTIREKWEKYLKTEVSWLTENFLQEKFQLKIEEDNIFINGSILPDEKIFQSIQSLKSGQSLAQANILIASRYDKKSAIAFTNDIGKALNIVQFTGDIFKINFPWEVFQHNGKAIEADFKLLTTGRKSDSLNQTNNFSSLENIFVEDGAKVEFSTLNASAGPIYIGKDAEVMEGCLIRGPFALGTHATLKMGAKIYGPTTIGPNSKVGGEINNCVIQGNSNKAHDGFLGNSVLGEWCNLGADTNNSNLKNNYTEVKLWSYSREKFVPTGLQFCGMIMGDHSKCGINTMFNTGTVVGVSANIFGAGYPRNFIPSFSWGGANGLTVYPLDKSYETASKVLQRRSLELTETDKKILQQIFIMTEKYRRF